MASLSRRFAVGVVRQAFGGAHCGCVEVRVCEEDVLIHSREMLCL